MGGAGSAAISGSAGEDLEIHLKDPCTKIVNSLGPVYLYGEYFKAKGDTIWVHGP